MTNHDLSDRSTKCITWNVHHVRSSRACVCLGCKGHVGASSGTVLAIRPTRAEPRERLGEVRSPLLCENTKSSGEVRSRLRDRPRARWASYSRIVSQCERNYRLLVSLAFGHPRSHRCDTSSALSRRCLRSACNAFPFAHLRCGEGRGQPNSVT